jgi:hypothetical protein
MLTNGVDPQHVQKTLRHANLQFTLRTYVHWVPSNERPTNVVSSALRRADENRTSAGRVMIRTCPGPAPYPTIMTRGTQYLRVAVATA